MTLRLPSMGQAILEPGFSVTTARLNVSFSLGKGCISVSGLSPKEVETALVALLKELCSDAGEVVLIQKLEA